MANIKAKQPTWVVPQAKEQPVLKLYNSLTKKKDVFIPLNNRQVTWYTCGPTVYAPSHIGHARTYLASDITRRILEEYFGYDVLFVMNITDIDDKIIISTRHKVLFEKFKNSNTSLTNELIESVNSAWIEFVESKFSKYLPNISKEWKIFESDWVPGSKNAPTQEAEPKYKMFFSSAKKSFDALEIAKKKLSILDSSALAANELIDASRDQLSIFLDNKDGHTITDQKSFRDFARFYEKDYFEDMESLNIKKPDILTRVTEYVPEVVEFVEKIIENGFAYESGGSVYFDTVKFDSHPNHFYAKLEPWSAGDVKLLAEGEGDLSIVVQGGKKNNADFALWKKSKDGEPAWPSKWGEGRPGWHIECSVMASHVLGSNFDIHSGGVDLAFPHHDNEIAQSEAAHNCKQWVNYFLHNGHLHIEGQKMSKSLKNFISIKDAIKIHNVMHIRILFLLHSWESTLYFDEKLLNESKEYFTFLNNFFTNVRAEIARNEQAPEIEFTGANDFGPLERSLVHSLNDKQAGVHVALCDSFNTPKALLELRDLVSAGNIYLTEKSKAQAQINPALLTKVANYIMKMMRIFGVIPDEKITLGLNSNSAQIGGGNSSASTEEIAAPFMKVLGEFRDEVRKLTQDKADPKEFLSLCDRVRDFDLVELGVALDDKPDGHALVKFVDKETLLEKREEKLKREEIKKKEKESRAIEEERKRLDKLAKGKVLPEELFKDEDSLKIYSKWDEKGIPTHGNDGEPVPKSKRKKLEKDHTFQIKLHAEYLKCLQ